MDQIQSGPQISHLLQVYPQVSDTKLQNPQIIQISHPTLQAGQGKVTTYQQTITSDIHIPVSSIQTEMIAQNHIVMSCQQTHLQTLHPPLQGQVIQSTDLNQQLQITSHMLLPPVPIYKQQMLVNEIQQFYGHYEYAKEQCVVAKVEPASNAKTDECKTEETKLDITETTEKKKRSRNLEPVPSTWACNVRKLKHQRGEAYISRRGKYVPERKIKNTKDCIQSCKFKCNERIPDCDRETIFRAFYSLNTNEKRHFLLNTTERHDIKYSKVSETRSRRKYSFKYYFIIRAEKMTVCKNFYLGTLAISQKPVYSVHINKSDINLPKPDGRGQSETSRCTLPTEIKNRVRKHILSLTLVDSKPVKQFSKRKQYLPSSLSIKKIYNMYYDECMKENIVPVKESMYRKIFKKEFNLHFTKKKKDDNICCKCKSSIKKK